MVATFARSIILFQFSPLREGRLLADMRKIEMQFISILAPARGATISATLNAITKQVFQFSPLREGRH